MRPFVGYFYQRVGEDYRRYTALAFAGDSAGAMPAPRQRAVRVDSRRLAAARALHSVWAYGLRDSTASPAGRRSMAYRNMISGDALKRHILHDATRVAALSVLVY